MSLLTTLGSGVSALKSFSQGMEILGDNIANANTTGFKGSRPDYKDSFANLLKGSQSGDAGSSNGSTAEVGAGVSVASVTARLTQGDMQFTGLKSDLAVDGTGFFKVVDTGNANTAYATRAGQFRTDVNGFLVSPEGYQLQAVGSSGSSVNSVRIGTEVNGVAVDDWRIGQDGSVTYLLADGSEVASGQQVMLMHFSDPQMLRREGNSLFSNFDAAGLDESRNTPGTSPLGRVLSEYLELSNVDLTEEFATMITTQRSFQAGARIITTSDQMLQEAINLKR